MDQASTSSIDWVVCGLQGASLADFTSSLASTRYRAIAPARELARRGFDVRLIEANSWAEHSPRGGTVVIGKLLPGAGGEAAFRATSQRVLAHLDRCRAAGASVIADFNDDHFEDATLGWYWRSCAALATHCTASSEAMSQAIAAHTKAPITVVPDPIQAPPGQARVPRGLGRRALGRWFRGEQRLKLAWYGNRGNWPAMHAWLERLAPMSREVPWICWIVTRRDDRVQAQIDTFNQQHGPAAAAMLVEWDEDTQWRVVHDCDVVLVPSDDRSAFHRAKSANRVADALAAGRYVVASPVPAYQPLAAHIDLTDDPAAALGAYLRDPDDALRKIEAGQASVAGTLGVQAVATCWQHVFENVAKLPAESPMDRLRPDAPMVAAPARPVRLNLGCGDKILPGFVNVDVVESRAGHRPDVICDLHKLTFDDDHADEVMAIHVVEHFWRWEIEDVLREWIRVLKPGGRMVIECPNLLSACQEFLKDPERFAAEGREGQRTMWVFYGDPQWKDPYMIHRWGYTPASLMTLMRSVGLVEVSQQPAQYKLREPRDMRVVGYKAGP